jgi:uncharacterized protein
MTGIRLRRRLLLLATTCLIAACASSPTARFYRLDPLELSYQGDTGAGVILALGPMSLPDYLQRPQMVRRDRGAEVLVDELNRWAEPLDEQVPRIIAANVDGLADDIVVVPSTRRTVTPDYRLFATVLRFDADTEGLTELVIQWGITAAAGTTVVPPRTSRYQTRATPADDPDAMASAMSALLGQVSRDMVDVFRRFGD